MASFAPYAITRPRWLLAFLRDGGLPNLTVPNVGLAGEDQLTFFRAYGQWMQTLQPTWADIGWLRQQWAGRFVVKAVMHPDDARRAVDAGADAISVSNHGGNNLDGAPAAIRVLPVIADAVGDQVGVLMDGGVRRGSDVVKGLALGARAVLIGRAYLWGLAAGGEAGVANVLEILRAGIDETLVGLGRSSIHELSPEDVIVPPGFTPAGAAFAAVSDQGGYERGCAPSTSARIPDWWRLDGSSPTYRPRRSSPAAERCSRSAGSLPSSSERMSTSSGG